VIIDAHAHLGTCDVFDLEVTEADLLDAMDSNGIDAAIVQPFPGCGDPRAAHDAIANLAVQRPGRIWGLASMNPHVGEDAYRREIERCVRDLRFVGVKLHTIGHAVNPTGRIGARVFEAAALFRAPVMIHTGPGVPFALPAAALPLARRYPDLPIVLAHAGHGIFTAEAVAVASACPNVMLETSWCTPQAIRGMVRSLGPDRVLFGSDMPINLPSERAKYGAIGLTDEETGLVLGGTAASVFRLGAAARSTGR
jgi:predicted TIM-barrel fold metal-dependent hydrolase